MLLTTWKVVRTQHKFIRLTSDNALCRATANFLGNNVIEFWAAKCLKCFVDYLLNIIRLEY